MVAARDRIASLERRTLADDGPTSCADRTNGALAPADAAAGPEYVDVEGECET